MSNDQFIQLLDRLRDQAQSQLGDLQDLMSQVEAMIEENYQLQMENRYLKERLDSLTGQGDKEQENPPKAKRSESLINLEKIYDQGFHICNSEFGKRRASSENCVFCLEILYKE